MDYCWIQFDVVYAAEIRVTMISAGLALDESENRQSIVMDSAERTSLPTCTLFHLPTELLIDIFQKGVNHWSLLLVCKYLRNIICSTPSFWESIFIGKGQCVENAEAYLTSHLERSQTYLLEVSIRSAEPTLAVELELWHILMSHRDRFRTFSLWTDKISLCARILHTVLIVQGPSALPFLRKLGIDYGFNLDSENSYHPIADPMSPQRLLRPTASLFPCLTSLFLPFVDSYIPYLTEPLQSLDSLVLYGSTRITTKKPSTYQISRLLSHTPQLETFWCKTQHTVGAVFTNQAIQPPAHSAIMQGILTRSILQPIELPILLPRLARLAITVPGYGAELLQLISAPHLHDLHLDGTRDDEELGDHVAWLADFPADLYSVLQAAAPRSPELRRLAVIGVYLPRAGWEELLGCRAGPPLFPFLESIAFRGIEAVWWEVRNEVDDALIELCTRSGRLSLRRFVYLGCEPELTARSLHQLVESVVARKAKGEVFEIEVDSRLGDDTQSGLRDLLELGIKATLHTDPPQIKSWWDLGGDIDPTEASSY